MSGLLDDVLHWEIFWTLLIGLAIGLLAGWFTSKQRPGGEPSRGYFDNAVVGVVGALVATYAGNIAGLFQIGAFWGFVAALAGATVLSVVYHFMRGRS